MMSRFFILCGVVFLVFAAVDPKWAVAGYVLGGFLMFISLVIGPPDKEPGGSVFATGLVIVLIAWFGGSHYEIIRIVALCAAGAGLVYLAYAFDRYLGRRDRAESARRIEHHHHHH